MIGPLSDLSDWLLDLSGQPVFLLAAFVVALLDSIIPVVPSETMLIVGGVAAGTGHQTLGLVIYKFFVGGNDLLAAAFALVPIGIMVIYLLAVRRSGALENL